MWKPDKVGGIRKEGKWMKRRRKNMEERGKNEEIREERRGKR